MQSKHVFSFSERGFYGASPTGGAAVNLPKSLDDFVRREAVRTLTWAAIGPDERWYVSWVDARGIRRIDTSGLEPHFDFWLRKNKSADEIYGTRVFLGPNGTCFAHSPTWGTRSNLAGYEDLQAEISSRIIRGEYYGDPQTVALGKDGAWVLVGAKGDFVWNLRGNYTHLEKKLTDVGVGIEHVALSAWDTADYAAMFTDGSVQWLTTKRPEATFLRRAY